MKKLLILGLVVVMAGTISAQSPKKRTSLTTTVQGRKPAPSPSPPPLQREPVQGAIPRAFRGGNPLQMLNPKAPAKYGTADQSLSIDPETGKWRGIKLFEIVF